MQLRPPGEPLPAPNTCFLCEQWPNPDAKLPVIDTGYDFEIGVTTRLSGRKLVCHGCAATMARLLDFVDPTIYAAVEASHNHYEKFSFELQEALADRDSEAGKARQAMIDKAVAEVVEAMRAAVAEASKPVVVKERVSRPKADASK
ncbi:MAG: hypothetical protein IT304_09975 [Dehalococcoidia bacterium]|nr:hypothetical protein [Dehalococcoidia bacterium]